MASRRTSLSDYADLAIAREIDSKYDDVRVVADNIDKVIILSDNIEEIGELKLIADEIVTVAGIQAEIASLSTVVDGISALYDDIHVLNSLFADKEKLDSLFADKTILDSLYADKIVLDSLYADKVKLDGLFANLVQINRVYQSIVAVDRVALSANHIDVVAADITKINTVASNITNVNTVGSNITKINTVSTDIDSVVLVADNIVPNLTEILQVDTLATQVAEDRSDVAAMKLAVETIYDTFDNRFLGAKLTDPIVDNDGNPLVDGAMYFNTSTNVMKVYDAGNGGWLAMSQLYLSGLLDVQLTSITTGDVLTWNGSKWVNTRTPSFDSIKFNGGAATQGTVSWNADESTLDVVLNGATLQVGQEQLIRVRNNSGVSITNGMAVMATGTVGNSGRITVAKANLTQANAKYILGVVTETIGVGADGFCTTFGKVRGIQTNGAQYGETWVDGDVLYVKDSGSGALTNVVPTDTQVKLPVAIVVNSHATNGTLFIRVNSIDENHAKVELATKVAKNASITAATHTKITYDSKGLVTSGTDLVAGDIPSLDASKITSGTLTVGTSGNAGTATKLQTARTINGVSFDGTANINVNTVAAEVIKFDTGTTEGTDLYTFNGSTAKTIDIKAGTNVTLTKSAGSVTISANDTAVGVTEITGMGTGASTFLATPSSANLAAMLTDETGTGAVVFANSPTFTGTPLAPTATVGTNTTQLATTAYVVAEINKIEEW